MINRFKKWNMWRKRSLNSGWYKFFVLIGIVESPTFEMELLNSRELWEEFYKGLEKSFWEDNND